MPRLTHPRSGKASFQITLVLIWHHIVLRAFFVALSAFIHPCLFNHAVSISINKQDLWRSRYRTCFSARDFGSIHKGFIHGLDHPQQLLIQIVIPGRWCSGSTVATALVTVLGSNPGRSISYLFVSVSLIRCPIFLRPQASLKTSNLSLGNAFVMPSATIFAVLIQIIWICCLCTSWRSQ